MTTLCIGPMGLFPRKLANFQDPKKEMIAIGGEVRRFVSAPEWRLRYCRPQKRGELMFDKTAEEPRLASLFGIDRFLSKYFTEVPKYGGTGEAEEDSESDIAVAA